MALAGRLAERDIGFIDAPVSGGVQGAEAGTLAIMAGGGERLIARWAWLFEIIGRGCVHCGPVGSAHALKALNNLLSAGGLLLAVEALAVGKRFGLSPSVMLTVINQSSGANNSTRTKLVAGPVRLVLADGPVHGRDDHGGLAALVGEQLRRVDAARTMTAQTTLKYIVGNHHWFG